MNQTQDVNYYLVRTLHELIERDTVGIGWSDYNFEAIGNAEETIRMIDEDYGIGRYGNQIRRFFSIRDNDLIVATVPYAVAIGRASGGLIYNSNDHGKDWPNQRRVVFPRDSDGRVITVPRSSFSEAFQRRLRVQGMVVNDLAEFANEIEDAYASIAKGTNHSWLNQLNHEVTNARENFKKKLLANIQCGRTNLQTGGTGLEYLVRELLELEGYTAKVLSKQHFGSFADADIQASRADRCALVNLLVQVKHHQGYTNEHGIRQLQEIRRAHQGEYDDHQRVLVTSASVSEELLKIAEEANITVIGGLELADWISEHIEKLSQNTKAILGIYEVPAVL